MNRTITILTGPVQTGKTTTLLQWSNGRNDVAGILTPVIEGERWFYDIVSRDKFPMNATEVEKEKLEVGRFVFSARNFARATGILKDACKKDQHEYLIIDEIGPLELNRQEGFYAVLMELLQMKKDTPQLIIVTRENCLAGITAIVSKMGWSLNVCSKENFPPT